MFKRFLPQEVGYFDFFERLGTVGKEVCSELLKLSTPGNDIVACATRIKELEHKADDITHQCIDALHKTFITPIDRTDIQKLIGRLDDVIDSIDATASRIVLYEIKEIRPDAKSLAEVLVKASGQILEALKCMRNMKDGKAVEEHCRAVYTLENEGDEILRRSLVRLFNEETNAILVIKWKEIYERLEKATDRCESVANIIQGIMIEAS